MPRTDTVARRRWRERHRQFAQHAAKVATARLADSGRTLRPRRKLRPAA
jgi:hypothetical protein